MNKRKLFLTQIALLLFCFSAQYVWADGFTPLTLTGYNADLICDSGEVGTSTNSIDRDGWAFYSKEKKAEGGLLQTATSISGANYQIASFTASNALRVESGATTNGVLTLSTPINAQELWFLGTGAHGEGKVKVKVNYTDNTSSSEVEITFPDWDRSSGDGAVVSKLGRVSTNNNNWGAQTFCLFERFVATNKDKQVKSITFTISNNNVASIFAVSAYTGGTRDANNELYMIANAHFDTQWDWDVQTSIDQYVPNTLKGNFNLFSKYPNYQFNFEGAIKYMFAKEYYPTEYAKLKTYVANGRWHISGGSVDANEVMVASAESIIRNFLYGQEYYKKEFGIKGGNDIMLPDCFGFPYSLPTLGKHCGIIGFHSQKLSWGSAYSYNDLPPFGIWRGVDGSEIYAVHKPGAYVNQYKEDMSYNGDAYAEILTNKQKYGVSKAVRYFGTGDRGGSIDESTADWMEKSIKGTGPVTVKMVTPDEFFESITPEEKAGLEIWDNELPMTAHGVGCYTSQSPMKFWNRKGELLADATEKSSVFADWLGGLPYQSDIIRETWIRYFLWHQFHDDLPGTSIPKAYSYSYNDMVLTQLNFSKTLNNAVGAVARQMDTQTTGTPIVVFNPLSIEREEIVEGAIKVSSKPESISVYNPQGAAVSAQIIGYKNGELSFIFAAKVPSLGYATYDLRLNDNASASVATTLSITNSKIENEDYIVTINQRGDVSSIVDKKQSNKELLRTPIRLSMSSNEPGYWGSWEIGRGDVFASPSAYVDQNIKISIAEEGPLRASLKIVRDKKGSAFVQYIRLASFGSTDRIDFVNEVDWQTQETLLKVIFPLVASNPIATFDMSMGAIERGNRTNSLYEVAGHQWADITHSDNSYGISILNDSKYGWDKSADNTLRLTLIHTPKLGATADRSFQRFQDLGVNKFKYSFYRHMGDWDESTQWEASKLNQPLLAYETPKHTGSLGKTVDVVSLNTEKVAIKALKKAEASDNIVVRVHELTGYPQNNVEITFPANIVSAQEVNGLEENLGDVTISGNKIRFNIGKYQPKAFAVKLADASTTLSAPSSTSVELPYNTDVMSYDSRMRDGRFGTTDHIFPAELLDEQIVDNKLVADGITFTMGPRTNGASNAVKCQGQEITLPQMANASKLYILAASQNIDGSDVKFKVDGVDHKVKVEYVADYVGQYGNYFGSSYYRTDNVAHVATHRHSYSNMSNVAYHYLYIYKYAITISAGASKLTLPNDEDVFVFAVSLSDNENDNAVPASTVCHFLEFEDEYLKESSDWDNGVCGEYLLPVNMTASKAASVNETAAMASDRNSFTKWCDNSSSKKWLEYDFGQEVEICQWNVVHGGIEGDSKVTADFKLQYYDASNTLVNADIVTGNTSNRTNRVLNEPIRTSKVRLAIDQAEQGSNGAARIYSLDLFGRMGTNAIEDVQTEEKSSSYNYPNPFSDETTILCNAPAQTATITLGVYSVSGTMIDTVVYPLSEAGRQELKWTNPNAPEGIYFYKLIAKDSAGSVVMQSSGKMLITK